jgi:NADH:ubiquinone oxidoreductase subunit E
MERSTAAILSDFPPRRKELLIPILQEVQSAHGVLTDDSIEEVSRYLHVPVNRIYGVAAFYDQFRLTSRGTYHIQLCRGTACHLNGSSLLLKELEKLLRLKAGTKRRDGRFSLELVTCLGACGHGPVIRINGEYHRVEKPADLAGIIHSLKEIKERDGTGKK